MSPIFNKRRFLLIPVPAYGGKRRDGKVEAAQADEGQEYGQDPDPFPADAQKCRQQKRQIIYEHNLPVHVEETSCCHENHASGKSEYWADILTCKPDITEKYRCQIYSQHISDQDMGHGNLGQQAPD